MQKGNRVTTQTAFVVHDGQTKMALDVTRGKRRIVATPEGEVLQILSNARPKRVNRNQGSLFS